jgi:hypothetical protein
MRGPRGWSRSPRTPLRRRPRGLWRRRRRGAEVAWPWDAISEATVELCSAAQLTAEAQTWCQCASRTPCTGAEAMAAPSSEPGPAQGPITDDGAAPPARGAARRAGGGRDRRIVAEALDGDEGLVEEAFRRGRGVGGQGGELLESTPDGLRLAQQGGRTSRSRHPRDSRRRLLGRCGTDELTRRRPACLRVTRTPRLGGERDGPASVDGPSEDAWRDLRVGCSLTDAAPPLAPRRQDFATPNTFP